MSNERYDETNHLDLTHAPSLATYIGKTLASYVSGNRMPEISGDNRKRIPDHIRARYDRDCERLAEEVLRYITKAAPASPLPGGGWRTDFENAPDCEEGILIVDASKISPAVGTARFVEGEWRGYDHGYGVECLWPSPTHWMPLPAAPTGEPK